MSDLSSTAKCDQNHIKTLVHLVTTKVWTSELFFIRACIANKGLGWKCLAVANKVVLEWANFGQQCKGKQNTILIKNWRKQHLQQFFNIYEIEIVFNCWKKMTSCRCLSHLNQVKKIFSDKTWVNFIQNLNKSSRYLAKLFLMIHFQF